MKKIGSGWQVNVYSISEHTVYKVPHKDIFRYLRFLQNVPFMIFAPKKLSQWVLGLEQSQKDSLKRISRNTRLWEDFACPVFELSGAYYQQKVIPLSEYVKKIPKEEFKLLIDEFSVFVYRLYKHGLIDKSFNFMKNFGIINSRIVVSDLGELFSDVKQIEKQIKNRAWAKHYVIRLFPKENRRYFNKKMDEIFLPQVEN